MYSDRYWSIAIGPSVSARWGKPNLLGWQQQPCNFLREGRGQRYNSAMLHEFFSPFRWRGLQDRSPNMLNLKEF